MPIIIDTGFIRWILSVNCMSLANASKYADEVTGYKNSIVFTYESYEYRL